MLKAYRFHREKMLKKSLSEENTAYNTQNKKLRV
mgnify:CR=1 FL=1